MHAAELQRLRSTAVFAVADVAGSGIPSQLLARALESEVGLPREAFHVAPSPFPRADFLATFRRRSDRNAALDKSSIPVRGVVPPDGGRRVRRFYCRVAIEPLPLQAWEWDVVAGMLGADCELDRIEGQSLTRRNTDVLFAWVWAWSPDDIPLASELNLLNMPEGAPAAVTEVLIHLDKVEDYTYPPEGTRADKTPERSAANVLVYQDQVYDYDPILD